MNDEGTPYGLTIEQRDGYLYARVKALTAGYEIFAEILERIADECRRCSCTKAMIYRDVPSMPGVGNTFEIVDRMQKTLPGLKIALVNPYTSNSGLLDFAVGIAAGKGLDFEVFPTEDAALEWLGV